MYPLYTQSVEERALIDMNAPPAKSLQLIERIRLQKDRQRDACNHLSDRRFEHMPDAFSNPIVAENFELHTGIPRDSIHDLFDVSTFEEFTLDQTESEDFALQQPTKFHRLALKDEGSLRRLINQVAVGLCGPSIENEIGCLLKSTGGKVAIQGDIFCTALHNAIRDAAEDILVDAVLYEANLAISSGLIEDPKNLMESVELLLELFEDSEYVSYFGQKYPIAKRRLINRVKLIGKSIGELQERFVSDSDLLHTSFFGIRTSDELTSIDLGRGDSHCGGKSVSILTYASGSKIVYKPRSLSPEVSFNKLIDWFRGVDSTIDLISPYILDRGEYGWVEFVPSHTMHSEEDVRNYFLRYGKLIGLLYLCNATDIHHENLIASGAQPVVVDLETILQPVELKTHAGESRSYLHESQFFSDSAMFTAMVDPVFARGSLNGSPLARNIFYRPNSIELAMNLGGKIERVPREKQPKTNHVPTLQGQELNGLDYSETILEGFRQVCNLALDFKRALYERVFPEFFEKTRIRLIFRPTRRYLKVLRAINSAYAQENFVQFDELACKIWLATANSRAKAAVSLSEYSDLYDGDVPYFFAFADDLQVRDYRGRELGEILRYTGFATT